MPELVFTTELRLVLNQVSYVDYFNIKQNAIRSCTKMDKTKSVFVKDITVIGKNSSEIAVFGNDVQSEYL